MNDFSAIITSNLAYKRQDPETVIPVTRSLVHCTDRRRNVMSYDFTPTRTRRQSSTHQYAKYIAIPLTRNQFAIIDECDSDLVTFKRHAQPCHGYEDRYYAYRNTSGPHKSRKNIALHIVILERVLGFNLTRRDRVDHINHNTLDNRRENLRLATHSQNMRNRQTPKNNTSGYKGVCPGRGKWRARIKVDGKEKHLGYFDNVLDAAIAYNEAALFYYGEFAYLNNVAVSE